MVKLDEYQIKAVTYDEPFKLLVPAGPGAGKTRVLIERVKYLLEKGAKPESFLIITFSREAANELKERLSDSKDGIDIHEVNKMQISTIHSFCNELLRESGKSGFNILDDDFDERKSMFIRRYRDELGLKREARISGSKLGSVIKKFNEYSTFNVNTPKLTEYIKENYPVSQEYLDLIASCGEGKDFEYPYEDIFADEELRTSASNAQYLAVAEAYPKYLDLLEENNYLDYNQLQIKTLELLEENPDIALNSRFKNILIDEFQDTDPIQMRIFKHFMDDYESFTIVGDDDQSVYGFRGSVPDYFTNFIKKYGADEQILINNYRSGKEIVEFNEEYIQPYRGMDKELKAANTFDSAVYSLPYHNKDEQGYNIASLIKYLKNSGKLKSYNDVGILMRSVNNDALTSIIRELKKEDIPFDMPVSTSIIECDEVKAIITLLWYLKSDGDKYIPTKWEQDWLNLTCFDNPYFKLTDNTIEILKNKECEYQQKVLEVARRIYQENNVEIESLDSYNEIFKQEHALRNQIFEEAGRPFTLGHMTMDEMVDLGIRDEEDLKFFGYLNYLKENQESANKDKSTLLELYYLLLDMLGITENRFEQENEENTRILLNLALLSQTIANYEEIVWKHDLNGLFWYMSANLDKRTTPEIKEERDAVQIMTIHKSKGLQFEVVIVGNITRTYNDIKDLDKKAQEEPKTWDSFLHQPTFPTPIEFLKYKDGTRRDELIRECLEEKRILYVAMTRAKRILVLSDWVYKNDNPASEVIKQMKEKIPAFKDLTSDNYEDLPLAYDSDETTDESSKEETIDISYTSFSDYRQCPHDYNVKYNYGFRSTPNEYVLMGTIAHGIVDQIHQRHINGQEVTDEMIDEIFAKTEHYNRNIDPEDPEYQLVKEAIHKYWDEDGKTWDIMASEYPFHVIKTGYNLTGKIDLIVKEGNDITVIDFKTTEKPIKESDKKKYLEQLSIYAIALREDPQYKDYNIKKGMIYTIKNNKQYHFDLTDEIISNMEKEIEETVEKIKNHEYPRCNKANCQSCNRFKTLSSYDDIIEMIKSEFNGDRQHDRQIIQQAMHDYAAHAYGEEIIRELGRMLWDYLTPEEQEKFEKASQMDIPERQLLDSVLDDFNNQRLDEAFEKLDDYMKNNPQRFVDDEDTEYHYFENDMEMTLFEEYIKPEKKAILVPREVPILDLHYLYAYLLVEKDRLHDAEDHLQIALSYNPVSVRVMHELIDLYKKQGMWDKMNEYIPLTFRYSYTPDSLARTYRHLGFYYTEEKKLDIAVALYYYSLKYEDSPAAHNELGYLEHLGQSIDITPKDAMEILEKGDIPLVGNEFIVREYRNCGDRYTEDEDYENALHMYALAYALDDSIENQMRYKMTEAVINGDTNVNISL